MNKQDETFAPGNAAALREALKESTALLAVLRGDEYEENVTRQINRNVDVLSAPALSAPARNCGLYPNWEAALPAWLMETGEEVDCNTGFRDNAQLKRFLDWLFATAEGADHA